MTRGIDGYNQAMRRARRADSPDGMEVNKKEAKEALASLEAGGVTQDEAAAARYALSDPDVGPEAKAAIRGFVDAHARQFKLAPALRDYINWTRLDGPYTAKEPTGRRYHTEVLREARVPEEDTYSIMVVTGRTEPGAKQVNPNLAELFYVKRTNEKYPSQASYAGPFEMPAVPHGANGYNGNNGWTFNGEPLERIGNVTPSIISADNGWIGGTFITTRRRPR